MKTERINHPYYCVWCGEIQENEKAFHEHYKKCRDESETVSEYPGWSGVSE